MFSRARPKSLGWHVLPTCTFKECSRHKFVDREAWAHDWIGACAPCTIFVICPRPLANRFDLIPRRALIRTKHRMWNTVDVRHYRIEHFVPTSSARVIFHFIFYDYENKEICTFFFSLLSLREFRTEKKSTVEIENVKQVVAAMRDAKHAWL